MTAKTPEDSELTPPKAAGFSSFKDISSRAWEHPADRAALLALRKVPGFDLIIRKVVGLMSERPLRAITAGSAVEVGPNQFPAIYAIYEEVLHTLDSPTRPALYVSQNPVMNAGAIGMDNPFIVLNSGTVNQMTDAQLRCVLGHELGHIMSDHVLYKTMLRFTLKGGSILLRMPLTGLALLGIVAAMLEWDRKSELSADRAALLACQDLDEVRGTLMRLAGGVGEGANIEAFRDQAARYQEDTGSLDGIIRTLALLGRRHPFPVHRIGELDKWTESGAYQAILDGEYPRRQDDQEQKAWNTWKESAQGYSEDFKATADPMAQWVKDTADDVVDKAGSALTWLRFRNKDGESDAEE